MQPYAVFGLGVAHGDVDVSGVGSADATDFGFRAGGGVDFYVTNHFVLDAEVTYVYPTGDLDGLDYVSLGFGIQYRF